MDTGEMVRKVWSELAAGFLGLVGLYLAATRGEIVFVVISIGLVSASAWIALARLGRLDPVTV